MCVHYVTDTIPKFLFFAFLHGMKRGNRSTSSTQQPLQYIQLGFEVLGQSKQFYVTSH